MARPNILFVHQNFPGQFPFIADAVRARGDRVAAIASPTGKNMPGIDVRRWTNTRGTTPNILPDAIRAEADMIRGRAAAEAAIQLKRDGFEPDVIVGHPGWGETLYLRDVFPKARQILLGEYYYVAEGGDMNFDQEFETLSDERSFRATAKNAGLMLAYSMADRIVAPTPFQAFFMPKILQQLITVHHEGIDLKAARRRPDAKVRLRNGRMLDRNTPIITFISRNLEPLRGFHIFMRALPAFLDAVPQGEVIIIGQEEGTGYGGAVPAGAASWKQWLLSELGERLDLSRVHFLGMVPHEAMIAALSIGAAHVYYTYPFILSWSLVEAMACECLVLGSDTAPLHDAITDSVNGLLNPFFDVDALSEAMIKAARMPTAFEGLRSEARLSARRFDREAVGVPGWLKLIDGML